MPGACPEHECNLFLLCSDHRYFADSSLARFARQRSRNIHGWGIGSYVDGRARVLRCAEPQGKGMPIIAAGRTDVEEYFRLSGIREYKKLGHTPLLVFVEAGDTVVVPPKEDVKIRVVPTIRDAFAILGSTLQTVLSAAALAILFQ